MPKTSTDIPIQDKMVNTPVSSLIIRLAIPTVISMLVAAIYNTADTFFVSKLGTSASGAVGIVFSIMTIIQSLGFMLGMGSGSLISRTLGADDAKRTNLLASTGFFSSLIVGLLIAIIGLTFLNPLLKILGSTATILPYARDYAQYILLGAPFMCGSYVLNNILRAEGKATFSMIGITAGGIINMILDPLFIFGMKLGISGAAIATVLSQIISFGILLSMFIRKKSNCRLGFKFLSRTAKDYLLLLSTGFPSFSRQALASIATAALNSQAAAYGDAAIAAMSISGRIFMLLFSIIIGLGQGFQPVAGYNFGAKNYLRVRQAILFSIKFGTIIMSVLGLFVFLLATPIVTAFRADDPEVIAIGMTTMRIQCLTMPLMGLQTISAMAFQILGKSFKATLLSSARQGLFFLPAIFFLPALFGLRGIQLAQPVSDLFAFIICLLFMIPLLRELTTKSKENQVNELQC